jgi:hypothetical protein
MKTASFISKNILPLISLGLLVMIVSLVTYNCIVHGVTNTSAFSALGE